MWLYRLFRWFVNPTIPARHQYLYEYVWIGLTKELVMQRRAERRTGGMQVLGQVCRSGINDPELFWRRAKDYRDGKRQTLCAKNRQMQRHVRLVRQNEVAIVARKDPARDHRKATAKGFTSLRQRHRVFSQNPTLAMLKRLANVRRSGIRLGIIDQRGFVISRIGVETIVESSTPIDGHHENPSFCREAKGRGQDIVRRA